MSPKSILFIVSFFLLGLTVSAQYTEKINTNRPGTSQGAFSVGNNVLQAEGGFGYRKEKHSLLESKTSIFNFDYSVRYGLLIEQLEISLSGRLRSDVIKQTVGANEEKTSRTNFEFNTIGAKYLIYDPYKRPKKDSINLNSWREQHKFKWKSLIPAVSGYIGMNYVSANNPFTFETDQTISPKFAIMTQNNWIDKNQQSWVLVTNFIVDKVTTDMPLFGWIITGTHTLNDKWAVFAEYQGQKSDFYSDNLLRLGSAFLHTKDLQFDANIAFNFKDTPSVFAFSAGASYRFDWHTKDEVILEPGQELGVKEEVLSEEEKELQDLEELEGFEGVENDSLKLEKTPFINEFEDPSHREAMEQDLDERRTAERLERERIAAEKQGKKDDKKFRKEEKKRLKREAKEAKKAEKAFIKAEKEKQKIIDDIDAELDKIDEEQGVDKELELIDQELKELEQMGEKPFEEVPAEQKTLDDELQKIDTPVEQQTDPIKEAVKETESVTPEIAPIIEEKLTEEKAAELKSLEDKSLEEELLKMDNAIEQETAPIEEDIDPKVLKAEKKRREKEEKKRLKEEKKRLKAEEKAKKQQEKEQGI